MSKKGGASRATGSRVGGKSRLSRLSRAPGQSSRRGHTTAAWESNRGPPMIVEVVEGVEYDVTPRSLLDGVRRSANTTMKAAQAQGKGGETRGAGVTRVHGAALDSRIQESKDFGFSYDESAEGQTPTQSAADSAMERLLNVGAHKNAKEELASKQAEAQGGSKDGKPAARGINRPAPAANAPLTEEQKETFCDIVLEETATKTLLKIRGLCVMKDTETDQAVTAQNAAYDKLVQSKLTSDNFSERAAQTFNFAPKNKEAMAAPPATRDSSAQSTAWDIYDNTSKSNSANGGDDEEARRRRSSILGAGAASNGNDATLTKINEVVTSMLMSEGCLVDLNTKIPTPPQPVVKKADKRGGRGGGGGGQSRAVGGSRAVGSRAIGGGSRAVGGGSRAASRMTGGSRAVSRMSDHSQASNNSDYSDEGDQEDMNDVDDMVEEAHANITTYDAREGSDILLAQEATDILASTELINSLAVIERAIAQNIIHKKFLVYRDVPSISDILGPQPGTTKKNSRGSRAAVEDAPDIKLPAKRLERLWSFKCALTAGRAVSGALFNPLNSDLLAVSYGQYDFSLERKDGLLCLWSLKNPMWPQRIYQATSGVCSLDWSTQHPTLIAVGHYDGNVAVYDVRRQDALPVLESSQLAQKHTGAVWQVKWVQKGPAGGSKGDAKKNDIDEQEKTEEATKDDATTSTAADDEQESTETLVSISTDGRIAEWSIKKGLSCSDLMVLKRIPNEYFRGMGNISIGTSSVSSKNGEKESGGERGDGIISRQASGMCFDFPNGDGTTYLAGTEDGIVHRCSVSYNEQYLDNYFGHSGPIYRIRFSPFHSKVFVTCSADWTIKLWHLTKQGRYVKKSSLCGSMFSVSFVLMFLLLLRN